MDAFEEPQVPSVSCEKVKNAIDTRSQHVLLDVRTTGEFARGKIEGSINLPVDDVASKVLTIIPDKTKMVYVYCLSGSRSKQAVDSMIKLGYANVFSMEYGILGWRAKWFPTVA